MQNWRRPAAECTGVAGSISWIEMTKPQLVESVATATGQTKSEVERTLDAILDRASNALAGGDRVELRGFGIFEAKKTKARTGRNPATGRPFRSPPARGQLSVPAKNSRSASTDSAKKRRKSRRSERARI